MTPRRWYSREEVPIAAAFAVVLLIGIWIISPRFAIAEPSIVDDWSAIDNAPRALDELTSLSYHPDDASDSHRYRPGYTALWNNLQWHTLGAPDHLTGPNVWNVLKVAIFVAGLTVLMFAVIRSPRGPPIGSLWIGLLAAIPAALVLTTPKTGEDFARFGPVEPLLVGAMALGATLLVVAVGHAIRFQGGPGPRHTAAVAATGIAGYALWIFGVYQKEASVCFLALAPFLYMFLSRRWQESGVLDKPLIRYRAFQVAAIAMLLPVLHMAVEIVRLAGEGTTVYGATIPHGTGGIVERLVDAFDLQWRSMTGLLQTSFWTWLAILLPFLLVLSAVRLRRIPWLPMGLVAAGWAAFVFQGLSGTATARYYIPTMALFGVAAVLLLAEIRLWPRLALMGVAILFVVSNANFSNGAAEVWANSEKDGNRAVRLVADLDPDRCPVYMSGVEEEVADAFPELVKLQRPFPTAACGERFTAFMLRRRFAERVEPVTNERILKGCAGQGWTAYSETKIWRVFACRRLKTGKVEGQSIKEVLNEDRLVPGQRFSERNPTTSS